ncbi:ORF13R [Ictalurid herpesvirus 1]|nr:ORF13L [Ictalurid herpesvirus 1]QAB08574.1 ORF13R [Ictalurid herpesvirus 1]
MAFLLPFLCNCCNPMSLLCGGGCDLISCCCRGGGWQPMMRQPIYPYGSPMGGHVYYPPPVAQPPVRGPARAPQSERPVDGLR